MAERKDIHMCDTCVDENGDLPQAVGYCENCNDYLCENCFEHHKKPKPLRNHIIFRITESKQELTEKGHQDITDQKCKLHSKYFVEFYCQDHDQVGCANCHLIDHKSCETVTYLREVKQDILCSTRVNEHISTLKELQHEAECIENDVKKRETKLNENTADCITNIQDDRKKIDDQVNKLHTRVLNQAKNVNETNVKVLKTVLDKCVEIKGTITEQIDEIEKNIEHGHARNMYVSLIGRDAVIKSIKDVLMKTAADNHVKLYKYICDPQLQKSIFEDIEQFGILEEIIDGSDEADGEESIKLKVKVLTNKQMSVSLQNQLDETSKALKEREKHNAALVRELQLAKERETKTVYDLKQQLAINEKHATDGAQRAADMKLSYSRTIGKLEREINSLKTETEMRIKQQEEEIGQWKDKLSRGEDALKQKHLDMKSIKTRLVQASEHINKFCAGICNARPQQFELLTQKLTGQLVCKHCQKTFKNKEGRIYCSQTCIALVLKSEADKYIQAIIATLFDTV